jgi:hypothetical protein
MPNHQDQAFALRNVDQFLAFSHTRGHGLLNQDMFLSKETRLGEREVMIYRSGNHNGIKTDAVQEMRELGDSFHLGVQGPQV